jgi:hypothetical protein
VRELTVIAIDRNESCVTLAVDDGEMFQLAVTAAVSEALSGLRAAKPAGASDFTSAPIPSRPPSGELRPKEIQARVRSGETAHDIAALFGVSLERVTRFAEPVLREREHIASLALRADIRLASGASPGQLGDVVTQRLASHGIDEQDLDWDAHRLANSRWRILLSYRTSAGVNTAHWEFDLRSRTASATDDDARWLTADISVPRVSASNAETLTVGLPTTAVPAATPRRLISVPPERRILDLTRQTARGTSKDFAADAPVIPSFDTLTSRRTGTTDRQALADGVTSGHRATVPAWDEILLGAPPRRSES